MNPAPANENELYFQRGGPIQKFGQNIATKWGLSHSIGFRILVFLGITWIPLVLLAVVEGRALGASPQESLLLDFSTYARFFLAVPLLIVAELVVGPRLRAAGLQFLEGGFVRQEDLPAFERAIARVARLRESAGFEAMIVVLALLGAWGFTTETVYAEGLATWRSTTQVTAAGATVSLTGLWYRLVALPVLQFFWYRWLWRLWIWARFLWDVSRLNLNLVATHADQAGGLGFLGTAHSSLGIFAFGLSSVLSAEAAFLMVFNGADISSFQVQYIAIVVILELILLGPLIVFSPGLIRTRLSWLRDYSLLVTRYNRAFDAKWIRGEISTDDSLLGSPDIQSQADLGNTFDFVRAMKAVPFSRRVAIDLAFVTSLPCLPLLLLVMPIDEILNLLTKAVF